MKKQILTLALAGLMTVPASAAETAMFGPGQPIVGTPQTPVPQAGYSSAVGPVISIDEIEGRVRSDNLQIQMMDRQLRRWRIWTSAKRSTRSIRRPTS